MKTLPKKIEIIITSKDVKRNKHGYGSNEKCPLAMAIKRQLKNYKLDVEVGVRFAYIHNSAYLLNHAFGNEHYLLLNDKPNKVFKTTLELVS